MPISLSAKKSLRKSVKNNKENVLFKTKLKLIVKKFLTKPNDDSLKEVYSILDKAVKKGIFHKNKTSRLKANYAEKLKDGVSTTKAGVKKTIKAKVKKTSKSKSTKKM
jgi:small subunit ribosomal protein S20